MKNKNQKPFQKLQTIIFLNKYILLFARDLWLVANRRSYVVVCFGITWLIAQSWHILQVTNCCSFWYCATNRKYDFENHWKINKLKVKVQIVMKTKRTTLVVSCRSQNHNVTNTLLVTNRRRTSTWHVNKHGHCLICVFSSQLV